MVVPTIHHALVLGIDFWKPANIRACFETQSYKFGEVEVTTSGQLEDETNLDLSERRELKEIIGNLRECGQREKDGSLENTSLIKHVIRLKPGSEPVKQRHYPLSPPIQAIMNKEIDVVLGEGIIEDSNSP